MPEVGNTSTPVSVAIAAAAAAACEVTTALSCVVLVAASLVAPAQSRSFT